MRIRGWAAALAWAVAAGCGGGAGEAPPPTDGREPGAAEPVETAAPAAEGAALPDTAGLHALTDSDASIPAPAAAPAAPTADPEGWTAGRVERRAPQAGVGTLTEVRTARNPGFDRVVLQFSGDAVPGYQIEYVDRPVRQCGSGEPVSLAGDGWLQIRLTPARMHDDRGRPTVVNRGRAPNLPVLRELRATCDFEAQVEWVLGVASPNRFRVLELRSPTRLVVDVRH